MRSAMSTASVAVALMLASLGPVDQTDPFGARLEPVPRDPRPPEAEELGKAGRKVYSRVMRETGDRAAAMAAALEAVKGNA